MPINFRTFAYLNVEPTSPIQAMSFDSFNFIVYYLLLKTIRSWKKNFKPVSHCGVLLELRAYYIIYKPKEYLFNGYRPGKRYSVRSIQHLMQKALIKVGLVSKNYTIHTICHSFATHLVDNGTDLHTVKELLGHSCLQTTMQYMHLSKKRIDQIVNLYDALPESKDNQHH